MEPADSPSRSTLTWVAAVLAIVTLGAVFSQSFVLIPLNLMRLGLPLALSISAALTAFSAGFLARRLLAPLAGDPDPLPHFASDFVVGYPLLGGIVYLISLGAIRPALSALILVAGALTGAALLAKWNIGGTREPAAAGISEIVTIIVLVTCALLAFSVAQLPAVSLDETAYHLAVPRVWVNEGHVVDLPLVSHSWFPLGTESVDVLFLSLLGAGGATASHFLHLLVAAATTWLLLDAFRQRGVGPRESLILLAAVVTTPALIITAGWSGTDWPLVGCVLVLLESWRSGSPSLMALAIAAGMLTKYTFLPFIVIMLPVALAASANRRRLLMTASMGAIFGSIFLVRNLTTRGNPFAPFLSAESPSLGGFHAGPDLGTTVRNYLFDGALVDDSLGIGLLCCLIVALLWLGTALRTPGERACFAGLSIVTLLLASRLPASRLLVPYLIAMVVVGSRAAGAALEGPGPLTRSLRALLLLAACAQLGVFVYYADSLDPVSMMTGRRSESDVVHGLRKDSGAVEALDALLPPRSRTLVLGVNELFAFTHSVRGGGNFDSPLVTRYLQAGSATTLIRDGFTHLAVFDSLAVGAESPDPRFRERRTTISPQAAASLRNIVAAAKPAGTFPGGRLYSLR